MAKLFADEDFDGLVIPELQALGHDVLTADAAGLARKKTPDSVILSFATTQGRAVLTHDTDFIKLHKQGIAHAGILLCTRDPDRVALAQRIDRAIGDNAPLDNKLIRVRRPSKP